MTQALRSGQVAAAAGVNRQTLRYYERRGLSSSRTAARAGIAFIHRRRFGSCE